MRELTVEREDVQVVVRIYDERSDLPYINGIVKWSTDRLRVYAEAITPDGAHWLQAYYVARHDLEEFTDAIVDDCIRAMRTALAREQRNGHEAVPVRTRSC